MAGKATGAKLEATKWLLQKYQGTESVSARVHVCVCVSVSCVNILKHPGLQQTTTIVHQKPATMYVEKARMHMCQGNFRYAHVA